MTEDFSKLDEFIVQKRQEHQTDALILDELVALGWDRALALRRLAGGGSPTPTASDAAAPVAASQTGAPGAPLQVENVQYMVKVGKVRSKVGFAAFVGALLLWAVAGVTMYFLLVLRSNWLPDSQEIPEALDAALVLTLSFLIPLGALGYFVFRRLNAILKENPAQVEDIFFKKTIRFHLLISLAVFIVWAIIALYNVLARLLLSNVEITRSVILNSMIYTAVFAALCYVFWSYQKMTRR